MSSWSARPASFGKPNPETVLRRSPDPVCDPAGLPMMLRAGLRNSPGHTKGYKLTADDLAGSLSFFLGRPVRDKTALTGKYDIELQWMPESVQMQPAAPPEAGPTPPVEGTGPSLFTALQEQLGLKLKSGQGPVKMLVVDGVERPSEN